MRITIDKGFRPLIQEVMQQIGTTDPKLAVNHIIGSWAASRQAAQPPEDSVASTDIEDDEFSELTDWS